MKEHTNKTNNVLQESDLLDVAGLMALTGYSRIMVYKLVRYKLIPYYKPFGGKLFFKRSEIVSTLTSTRFSTKMELDKFKPKKRGYSAVEDFERCMREQE